MDQITLSDREFDQFRTFIYETAGISLADSKKALVWGRLNKRLHYHQLRSFHEYFHLITSGHEPNELQLAIDLLTTNETYFFREEEHFDYLTRHILVKPHPSRFTLWSAACSSGEEPYSLAMTLSESLRSSEWSIIASDISSRVLETAKNGLYPIERSHNIPKSYLKKYCLKGIGEYAGSFLMDKSLKQRIRFVQINLNKTLPGLGQFDVVFLRNVLIYFDYPTKQSVIQRITQMIKPGGYLIVSHSESLAGITGPLKMIKPSIYING
ncbi:MAG: CheR family methyltransferase [Methylococcaceae bacterium]